MGLTPSGGPRIGLSTRADGRPIAKLRQDIRNEFPEHRNHIPLDISLQLLQMLGPLAFLVGRPDGATAARLPSFL